MRVAAAAAEPAASASMRQLAARALARDRQGLGAAIEQPGHDAVLRDREPRAAGAQIAAADDARRRRQQLGCRRFAIEELVAVGGDHQRQTRQLSNEDGERAHADPYTQLSQSNPHGTVRAHVCFDRRRHRALRRAALHLQPHHRDRRLPGEPAGEADPGRRTGRGRQDRARQGARRRPRPRADPPAVLRGPRRGQGALRVGVRQAAPLHPDPQGQDRRGDRRRAHRCSEAVERIAQRGRRLLLRALPPAAAAAARHHLGRSRPCC